MVAGSDAALQAVADGGLCMGGAVGGTGAWVGMWGQGAGGRGQGGQVESGGG